MFPSKLPIPILLHIIGIIAIIIVTLIVTGNPLAILGLFMMPEVPLVADQDEEEREPAIGFHADV